MRSHDIHLLRRDTHMHTRLRLAERMRERAMRLSHRNDVLRHHSMLHFRTDLYRGAMRDPSDKHLHRHG
jgi:hypothetical protein